jgi:hypothetical protein
MYAAPCPAPAEPLLAVRLFSPKGLLHLKDLLSLKSSLLAYLDRGMVGRAAPSPDSIGYTPAPLPLLLAVTADDLLAFL